MLTPVIPAPMIAISHSEGGFSYWPRESMGCRSDRQYERVLFGTGRPSGVSDEILSSWSVWVPLPKKDHKVFMMFYHATEEAAVG